MTKTESKDKEYPYGYICLSCGAVWEVHAWAEKNLREGTDLHCCFICAGEIITIAEKPYAGDYISTFRPREFG